MTVSSVDPRATSGTTALSARRQTVRATWRCEAARPPPARMKVLSGGSRPSTSSVALSSVSTWAASKAVRITLRSASSPVRGVPTHAPRSMSRDCTSRSFSWRPLSAASQYSAARPTCACSSSTVPSASKTRSSFGRRSLLYRLLSPASPVRVYRLLFLGLDASLAAALSLAFIACDARRCRTLRWTRLAAAAAPKVHTAAVANSASEPPPRGSIEDRREDGMLRGRFGCSRSRRSMQCRRAWERLAGHRRTRGFRHRTGGSGNGGSSGKRPLPWFVRDPCVSHNRVK